MNKIKRRRRVIGIVGTRRRDRLRDYLAVEKEFLKHYQHGDIICSGLCPKGADRFAVVLSEKYDTATRWYRAKWEKHGKAAGFVRNTYIARDSHILIACVAPDRTGGTEDTIKKYLKMGKKKLILV